MATELHTFTGNEVIATELPELLNQNFDYVRENSLKSVNGVEKDENNNVDVTFLTSQVIPTNSDLNNFRESGEYTREVDTVVVANSPTEKPFFLTVLASENLVKQVVTEIDRKDPMTFTRTLSGANWSPWVEGGVDIGIWKSEETVKVGDVRFLKGRENAGYVLECVKAGVTGESQPVLEGNVAEEEFNLNNFDGTLSMKKGGTGASTAEEARENLGITPANIGALPLSGGTINGVIRVNKSVQEAVLKGTDNSQFIRINSANSFQDGGTLALYGFEHTTRAGSFYLSANGGGSECNLIGKPDGTLTWNGKSLIVDTSTLGTVATKLAYTTVTAGSSSGTGSATKTISGVTINKPLYIGTKYVTKGASSNLGVYISSGTAVNATSGYQTFGTVGTIEWFTVIPTATTVVVTFTGNGGTGGVVAYQ